MPDYALMNQCLYEGKAKEVEQMTKDALAEGRGLKEVLEEGLIAGMSDEDFDTTMTINVRSPFILLREAARRLRDGGRIVNISTVNTVLPGPGMSAYAASKAALELLGRVAAYELGEREITVNSVLPGATDTEMFRKANPAVEVHEAVIAITALRRLGQPADIADVVAFLVSPDARWVTGQSIRVSGGLA